MVAVLSPAAGPAGRGVMFNDDDYHLNCQMMMIIIDVKLTDHAITRVAPVIHRPLCQKRR
jgi:hypothetical protein